MRLPRTLRGRLALSATLTAGTAMVLLTVTFGVLQDHRLYAEAENVLRSRADAARATVVVTRGQISLADLQEPAGPDVQDVALDTGIWVFAGTKAIQRAGGPSPLQEQAAALAGTSGRLVRLSHPHTELLSLAIRSRGVQIGTLVAAISLEPYERRWHLTVLGAIGLGGVTIVLLFFVASTVAARALRSVTDMTAQAGEWSATDTSGRFGEGARPGELEDLATTLDGVLGRLSAVLRREQQLSAEISHELRTPLAGIIAEADLYASRPRTAAESARAMSVVSEGARRMERILDTLLSAARAEAGAAQGRCDVVAVTNRLLDRVEVSPGVPYGGVAEEVLERLLAPLIDNASRYSDNVRMQVHATPEQVLVEVLDDGPGVPVGQQEAVFDAGYRGAPDDGHAGAGLGLALVRRLARAAGGDVTCQPGPGGHFTLALPPA